MKYNSGDIDDLFRRASERYPLRTDGADWSRLASDLDSEAMPQSGKEDERRKRRGAYWWFLLLPLAGAGYLTWHTGTHQTIDHATTGGKMVQSSAVKAATRETEASRAGAGVTGTLVKEAAANKAVTNKDLANKAAANRTSANRTSANRTSANRTSANKIAGSTNQFVGGNGPAVSANGGQQSAAARRASQRSAWRKTGVGMAGSGVVRNRTGGKLASVPEPADGLSNPALSEEDRELLRSALDLRRAPIAEGVNLVVDVSAPVIAVDDQASPGKKPTAHKSHGYIGLTAAPDFSTVKLQSMKGVGTTVGVLLGYAFNDRWAVETGLYLDRKRYYTQGEYFNTSKVRLPPNYKLLNVDGTCYMWEIPVNVRYNFSTGPRMQWFGTAGFSTYLMSKENYTYQYNYASGGMAESSHWNINRPSQYWFTILNVSAGFEQRIGKIGNLRLEPYIRIPTSGIGTGNLPIMSAGLNIGLTRQLW